MPADTGTMKVTLLGTGTSTGIPVIGCDCRVCKSDDPRDKRLRCACYIEVNGVHLLIDAGPDLRIQALRASMQKVDAVLLTHHHFDHVVGLDDLRPFFFDNRAPIPCFANEDTVTTLKSMFGYIFEDGSYPGVSKLELRQIDGRFEVQGRYNPADSVEITPIHVFHGNTPVLAFRIGNFAYVTDTNQIPEDSFALLEGVEVLVLDALRHEPHRTHYTIAEAVEISRRINAKETYFIHMTHSLLHAEEDAKLPEGMHLGYDGLCLTIN